MREMAVHCIVSGCTPEVVSDLANLADLDSYGSVVSNVVESLLDAHERSSQNDLSVIGPIQPSGQPYADLAEPAFHGFDLDPKTVETDIRVVPHCVVGDESDFGTVEAPPPNKQNWSYGVRNGCVMVLTYALDIMALATHGRMTPLRLWNLTRKQGIGEAYLQERLEGVDYGELPGLWEHFSNWFPGFTVDQIMELEKIVDAEVVKKRLVDEGRLWLWMTPDRFPVSPRELEYPAPVLPKVPPCGNRSAIESLPTEVLMAIVSSLPFISLLNLSSASRSLRTGILGNDYLAYVWMYNSAPWWIPVPTQTPRKDGQSDPPSTVPETYLASGWNAQTPLTASFSAGLGWAYIRRCVRSGPMRNRRRIWKTALDIERVADLAGV